MIKETLRKNPESVFYLVWPLVGIFSICAVAQAILKLKAGDPWYLVILLTIGIPGTILIVKMMKLLRRARG